MLLTLSGLGKVGWLVSHCAARQRARGHREGCGWARDGAAGRLGARDGVEWAAFDDAEEARLALRRLKNRGWRDVRWCAACVGEDVPC